MSERYNYIDFLRFVGLSLIVIAHIDAPFTITQIRTFDVPLMVFVSGLSYSGRTIKSSWSSFYYPRIKRIVVPVYIFLSLYFICFSLLGLPLTWNKVINSYLLTTDGGIGYVWIFRVFLLIMLVTPFLVKVSYSLSNLFFYFLLAIIFALNCVLVSILPYDNGSVAITVIKEVVPYLLGYSLLFLLGLRLRESSRKECIGLCIVLPILLIALLIINKDSMGGTINISMFKYPPTSCFIVYGAWVCSLLWLFRNCFDSLSNNSFVLFVGRNTIWIYLWHIVFVILSHAFINSWPLRYVTVYFGAIAIYYVQFKVVKYIMSKTNWSCLNYLIG